MKALKIIFFATRCLRKLNKKLGVDICTEDIRVMYYLHSKGPQLISPLGSLSAWKRIKGNILPRLIEAGYIHYDGKHYSTTLDGLRYMQQYDEMMRKARMDRIHRKGDTSKPLWER
ncbi:hypothetical protein [Agriterribacter sp.]|uniref:hypothetical protein n=1 Tax=Agriterribacter sp. TaxID=2821509 RepID=UPI002B67C957|nr:hypothetical protein [Agriterribacter sp.]HTN09232.1 hypothetical protein [Agriterribacter sp.]